jgi:hypothetical protein
MTKTKKLTADSGAEVAKVVQDYLDSKGLSKYIKFNFMGLQRLLGPVKIEVKLIKWTTGIGGTARITATGSDNQTVTLKDAVIEISKAQNKEEIDGFLKDAGLL